MSEQIEAPKEDSTKTDKPKSPDDQAQPVVKQSRRRRLRQVLWALGLLALGGFGFALSALLVLQHNLPEIESLADYQPPRASRLFDRNGEVLHQYYRERRSVVPFDQIPLQVRQAFLAAEDAGFYRHGGIDYQAIVRAAVDELLYRTIGGRRSGGSTITQQTAKTFFLSPEQTYSRKLREWLLAKRIEDSLSKDEILYLYLNQIYFGHGAYGVAEAARTYYNVGVASLSLAQAAALASVPKAPSRINPWDNPQRTAKRRSYVLGQMLDQGWITAAQKSAAEALPVQSPRPDLKRAQSAAYPAEWVRRELVKQFGDRRLLEGGLKIYSSLDAEMQWAAQQALQRGLRQVDKRQGYRGPLLRLEADERQAFEQSLRKRFAQRKPAPPAPQDLQQPLLGRVVWDLSALDSRQAVSQPLQAAAAVPLRRLKKGQILGGLVVAVDNSADRVDVDLGSVIGSLSLKDMRWARPFSPSRWTAAPKDPAKILRLGDVVLVKVEHENEIYKRGEKNGKPYKKLTHRSLTLSLEQIPKVQGAIVVIDPIAHEVRAMAGGYDFALSPFDRSTQARRQPGSSFKPLVYSAGLATRRFRPNTLITDAPKVFRDGHKSWKPSNYDGKFRGDITMRECLTHSVNMCSIQILDDVGVENVIELARKLGIKSPLPNSLTLALGSGDVTPLELISAYTVFPAGGQFAPPLIIKRVKESSGSLILENKVAPQQVLDPAVAYVMANLMRSVVEHGTARRALVLDRPAAGKTGTSNDQRNAWFIGYTPRLLAGVYVGFDDNSSLGRNAFGSSAALPIWVDFMQQALQGQPINDFAAPEGVVFARINAKSGLLASPDDPDAIDEVFLEGTEPTQFHQQAAAPPSLFIQDSTGGGL